MFEPLFSRGGWTEHVNVDIEAFLNADFAVAAFLISFGGLIGKVNPTQLTILTIVESFFYCFNKRIILERWIPLGKYKYIATLLDKYIPSKTVPPNCRTIRPPSHTTTATTALQSTWVAPS